jgi:hypothetical protein
MFEHDIATYVHYSELARDTKMPFGHDVALLVDYMHSKNEPSTQTHL